MAGLHIRRGLLLSKYRHTGALPVAQLQIGGVKATLLQLRSWTCTWNNVCIEGVLSMVLQELRTQPEVNHCRVTDTFSM